jgi:hypothetical protein
VPDETTFLPFLVEGSKAASRISKLRSSLLRHGNMWHEAYGLSYPSEVVSRMFVLCFLKAGMPQIPAMLKAMAHNHDRRISGDTAHLHQNRLYWRTDGWKPWDEARTAWTATAGPDAKMVFLEEKNWSKRDGYPPVYDYEGEF